MTRETGRCAMSLAKDSRSGRIAFTCRETEDNSGEILSAFCEDKPARTRFEKELVMAKLRSLVRESSSTSSNPGKDASRPCALQETANCRTRGQD